MQILVTATLKYQADYTSDQTATLAPGQYYTLHHINPLTVSLTRKNHQR